MKPIKCYLLSGALFAAVFGTLSHFIYEWSGRSPLAALFFPVNESTWEHMKLVFFPVLLYSLAPAPGLKASFPSLTPALLLGTLLGTASIPVLFYTYSGIIGRNYLAADILIFPAGVLIAFRSAWLWKGSDSVYKYRSAVYLSTALLAILFFVFSFLPPGIGLFVPPE